MLKKSCLYSFFLHRSSGLPTWSDPFLILIEISLFVVLYFLKPEQSKQNGPKLSQLENWREGKYERIRR